jgi:intein-encoded DNA endonuclease-like protein
MNNISKEIEKICKEYDIEFDPTLSEDFIKEFKDNVHWGWISMFQKLSEDFIREFKDEVNWYYISRCQKLSEDFREEFNIKIRVYQDGISKDLTKLINKEYPHICPKCKGPAYIGISHVDCKNNCS